MAWLDYDGLSHFLDKLKLTFAAIGDIPAAGSTTPAMDGTGATGTSTAYARADHVHPTDTSRAPTSHASSATTYGKGTSANYGHVKLSDATDGTTAAASGGTAATPKAVSDALAAAKTYADSNDSDTTYTLGATGSGSSRKVTLTPSSGSAQSVDVPDTTYSDFTGATHSAAGAHGLVPAPSALTGDHTYLNADGSWEQLGYPSGSPAGEYAEGLMPGRDKVKLDEVGSLAVCGTAAGTADKTASFAYTDTSSATYKLNFRMNVGAIVPVRFSNTNTAAVANLTLSVEGEAAKPIKYRGANLPTVGTLAAGRTYWFCYDGTNWEIVGDVDTVYTHPTYDAATAAAVKVGRDATGHVVIGDALTASDVGASATGHKHAAGDITSGTLGVARGGTGASTLGAGVVYHSASGTGALSIATAANLVSAIGNTAVNRATADASGNNIADTYAKKSEITGLYRYKGSVASESALPSTGQSVGDVWDIQAASTYGGAGMNVVWTGSAWDALGEVFSITAITNAQIDALFA